MVRPHFGSQYYYDPGTAPRWSPAMAAAWVTAQCPKNPCSQLMPMGLLYPNIGEWGNILPDQAAAR
jgi:hypothetical protein